VVFGGKSSRNYKKKERYKRREGRKGSKEKGNVGGRKTKKAMIKIFTIVRHQ